MKLIVGIGNPGNEYDNTRHNIGFMFLDYYMDYINNIDKWSKKFNGLYKESLIDGEKIIFLKPQSYVNLSGEVVSKFKNYFNIDINDILIICDDLDLNFLNYKLREKGSSAGHNGLKNIESCLGSSEYKRLKVGISNNKDISTKDYVLGKFSSSQLKEINEKFKELSTVLDDYFKIDFHDLMSKYNRKNK